MRRRDRLRLLDARRGGGWIYATITVVGLAAFLYPFWLPSEAVPGEAHADLAPFLSALLIGLLVMGVGVELRTHRMNGVTVALLGLLSASTGLLRLIDFPGGGSGMFPLLILAAAAFGPRFGLVLGMSSMALSALLTGGMGPWLPFQMLGAGWMGGSVGWLGRITARQPPLVELGVLAVVGWLWGFAYGAILNLWSWPFIIGDGSELAWVPGSGAVETLQQYYRYYVATSLAWDAAGATANAVVIVVLGRPLLTSMRRFAHRLAPVVVLDDLPGEAPPPVVPRPPSRRADAPAGLDAAAAGVLSFRAQRR
jgi:energy-coupling factor transport system substrate-specific component